MYDNLNFSFLLWNKLHLCRQYRYMDDIFITNTQFPKILDDMYPDELTQFEARRDFVKNILQK